MIKINIIPNIIKKEIKTNYIYFIIKKFLYILIIVFSIFATFLIISENILLSSLAKEINESTLDFKSLTNTSQNKVQDINNELNELYKIQNNFSRPSILLNQISIQTPEGITFSNLNIDNEKSLITFRGFATDRDKLLSFKTILENSDTFGNIDFPIKNLLLKKDINFEIKAKLNNNEIN